MAHRKPLLTLDEDEGFSSYVPPSSQPSSSTHTHVTHHHPQPHKHTAAYVEDNVRIPYAQAFDNMRLDKDNMTCFDCGNNQTSWVSLHFGVFICLKCAGEHRGLGVHISVVRSVNLDTWTPEKLLYLLIGGNRRAREYFSQDPYLMGTPISNKYNSPTASEYKKLLQTEHANTLKSLEQRGIVQPTPPQPLDTTPTPPPPNMRKFQNATSISSDQYFEKEKKKKSFCCF